MQHQYPDKVALRERRRNHRFNLRGHVRLDIYGRHFEFPAADISSSGIGVLLNAAVLGARPTGTIGHCIIDSAELGGTVDAYVSVMRIRRYGDQILVGLRFESISDEQLQIITNFETQTRHGKGRS